MSVHDGRPLTRAVISELFTEIGNRLARDGLTAEIAVFGGIAIALTFDFRDATQDMDYMPIRGDIKELNAIADEIGRRDGLSTGWFNDAVEIFKSDNDELVPHGEYGEPCGLRVFIASPRYIFAMKCMSMRSSMVSSDPYDVWNLIDACGLQDAESAIRLVDAFYPQGMPERNKLILMDLFDAKHADKPYDAMIGW